MDYYINPAVLTSVFTVPCAAVDSHLKLAKGEHIKVLLYIMRNMSSQPSSGEISENTGVSEYDVKEALLYWADAGIISPKEKPVKSKTVKPVTEKRSVVRSQKPSRTDVARRGSEDEKIQYLLREAQLKFGRILKDNEASTLVWLYDDLGLDISVIMLIIQYAVQHERINIRFIESTAVDFVNKRIDSISSADAELKRTAVSEQAWKLVSDCFGLERRKPSKKEQELSFLWVEEWKIPREMIIAAYEECVNRNAKLSMPYIAKIIESWHEKGFEALSDIENGSKTAQHKESYASYDLDLYERLMNSKDE